MTTFVQIPPDQLRKGMTTYLPDAKGVLKPDVHISDYLGYNRACRGHHFKTSRNGTVCYIHSTRVWIR